MNSENILSENILYVKQSLGLQGTVKLAGAKNAVLVIMASLILTSGKSKLYNVPFSSDVKQMIKLLISLGASVCFDNLNKILDIDTSNINNYQVCPEIMKKMRASILVMGPLLARFKKANVALPGGCLIGPRPIDFHLSAFRKMGVTIEQDQDYLKSKVDKIKPGKFVLDYPSVGATENIIMSAVLADGVTQIINAAIEPEVFDLVNILNKMGAKIEINIPSSIVIQGVKYLNPVEHTIIHDRLEAGALLLATAITGGEINLPDVPACFLEVFLEKLSQMGHEIQTGNNNIGIKLKATTSPQAISFKTMPYPGFPTDLQSPMMAALCLSSGVSVVEETIFENRLMHVRELQKMGAQITVEGNKAIIRGVDQLYGTRVISSDIRAAASLVLAGLAAYGTTEIVGIEYLHRAYYNFEEKLSKLGAEIYTK